MKRKKGTLLKSAWREIKSSLGRYIAILAITALGVGFFAGLIVTKSAMIKTGEEYLSAHRLFDFRILSTLGIDADDIDALRGLDGVDAAEGSYSADFISLGEDGAETVLRAHLLTKNINLLSLTAGRLPEAGDECIVDANRFSEDMIGKTVTVAESTPEDTRDTFRYREYTVTGLCDSPYYLNFERGNSALAGGSVSGFVYIPEDGFCFDYYTEIFVKLSAEKPLFSDEYDALIEGHEALIENAANASVRARYEGLRGELFDAEKALSDARRELEDQRTEGLSRLSAEEEKLREAAETLRKTEKELLDTEEQIDQREGELEAAYLYGLLTAEEYAQGKKELSSAKKALKKGKTQYAEAKTEYEEGLAALDDARGEFEEAIAEAEAELREKTEEYEAQKADFDALDEPEIFVLDRDTNTGYVCFESDSSIVEGIARVFPIFFFAVAALVCVTTMNRMIDEQRTQIGVLKALGYGTGAVTGKYLFYSGSAGALGAIAGFFLGSRLFPWAIWKTYDIMYGFADIKLLYDPVLAAVSVAVALICTMGTTWLSCKKELSEAPAQLIRPRAPKSGKRIILEHIGFIWRRMKFLHKVSARNLLRYKKRLIMMVLGIGGCTALVLTGLGLHDSIANVANVQFDEIQVFDLSVTFSEAQTAEDAAALAAWEDLSGVTLLSQSSVELRFSDAMKTVYMIAPKDPAALSDFVHLARDGEPVAFPETGDVVITRALSERLGIAVGDTVTVTKDEIKTATLTVSGIADNYIYDYIYLSPETCEAAFSEASAYKTAYVTVKEEADIHETAAALLSEEGVSAVSVNADLRERVDHMMGSLNYVIILVIACAAALAFIVLYNLTNINITERVREIATVKVLGFTRGETAAYVFRENIVLTLLGALLGLPMGFLLHRFVMANIVIDAVSFHVTITPLSYVIGIALTFVFALIVDLFMRVRLEKINMAESLKSVE